MMQSGASVTRTQNQRQNSKTQRNTTSSTNVKHECAPVCRIHVSIGVNKQLESLAGFQDFKAIRNVMQSGALVATTENQKRISKTQSRTTSLTHLKDKCTPVCRIHISFGVNQQLACFNVITSGSDMQSHDLVARTKNQKQISKTQCNTTSFTHFKTSVSTRLSHSRQLCLQSAAVMFGSLQGDPQRDVERCVDY